MQHLLYLVQVLPLVTGQGSHFQTHRCFHSLDFPFKNKEQTINCELKFQKGEEKTLFPEEAS